MQRDQMKKLFRVSAVSALISLAVLVQIDVHLRTDASPHGILSFELCAYDRSCEAIIRSWTDTAPVMAGLSLGLDYLFMLAYSAAICFGLLLTSANVPKSLQTPTIAAAYLSWAAGAADAFENYQLVQMLTDPSSVVHAWPASIAATVKFVFLAGTLSWLLFTSVRFRRTSRRTEWECDE